MSHAFPPYEWTEPPHVYLLHLTSRYFQLGRLPVFAPARRSSPAVRILELLPAAPEQPQGRRRSGSLIFLIVLPGHWSVNSLGNWIVVALWATCAKQFTFYRHFKCFKKSADLLRALRTCPLNLINAGNNSALAVFQRRDRFNFPRCTRCSLRRNPSKS